MKTLRIIALLFVLIMAGCNKLTMENYNELKAGMTYHEVVKIIGKPAACSDVLGIRSCSWGDEKKSITVAFMGDKVLFFSANNIR